eukprot:scaffold603_cov404-Prasinococcus_capsulatus_cf.AAC.18
MYVITTNSGGTVRSVRTCHTRCQELYRTAEASALGRYFLPGPVARLLLLPCSGDEAAGGGCTYPRNA